MAQRGLDHDDSMVSLSHRVSCSSFERSHPKETESEPNLLPDNFPDCSRNKVKEGLQETE